MSNVTPLTIQSATSNETSTAITINSVLHELEDWRTQQHVKGKVKSPIPEALWKKIFILAKSHSPSRLRAIFGISSTQYNKKLTQQSAQAPVAPAPTTSSLSSASSSSTVAMATHEDQDAPSLTEWKSLKERPVYEPAKGVVNNTLVVELRRADGHILKIHTTTQSLKELLPLFFDGAAPYAANLT